jgi:hypothetical protein
MPQAEDRSFRDYVWQNRDEWHFAYTDHAEQIENNINALLEKLCGGFVRTDANIPI